MTHFSIKEFETIRTTVTLPAELVERSQEFVDNGTVPSRNALIVKALEQFLEQLERVRIDAQFAAMADDSEYAALNLEIAEAFSESDWESLQEVEGVYQ